MKTKHMIDQQTDQLAKLEQILARNYRELRGINSKLGWILALLMFFAIGGFFFVFGLASVFGS